MIVKVIKCLIIIIFVFLSTGCWDYVGLDEITIVTGMAIDMNEDMNKYKLSFEVINAASSSRQKNEIKTEILESTGSTIFEAIRDAERRTMNKLYFSNTQVVIISNQIAREKGINEIIDFYLRDSEIRETLNFAISKEKTAKEILKRNSIDNPINAFEMKKIISEDNSVVSTTQNKQLYKIYNNLNCEGESLVLPVFHNVENDNEQVIESNGVAVFKKDKLIDYLTVNESKIFLFIDDNIIGGILTLDINNDKTDDVSIEITNSSTYKSFSYKKDKYKIDINIEIEGILAELMGKHKKVDLKKVNEVEKETAKKVKNGIEKLIKKAQKEFEVDIFGFGNLVYKTNPNLWKKIKKDWADLFLEVEFNVNIKVKIINTAFRK